MLLFSSRAQPRVDSVTPASVEPGQTVVVVGSGFGGSGRIELDGIAIPRGDIRMWRDDRLSFVMPAVANSGLLRVRTASGASRPVFLNSEVDLPRPVLDRDRGLTLEPERVAVGETFEIRGHRFGPRYARAGVTFASADRRIVLEASRPSIVSWTDDRIRIVLPPDVPAGTWDVSVNGDETTARLTVAAPRASRSEGAVYRYAVQLRATVAGAGPDALVVLPRLPETVTQPTVQLLRDLGTLRSERGAAAWIYAGAQDGVATMISRTELVERREVEWVVESAGSSTILLEQPFRRAFRASLAPTPGLALDSAEVRALRARAVDTAQSPDGIARAVHAAAIAALSPDPTGTDSVTDALAGDGAASAAYASLATSLARLAGLPARRNAGIIIADGGATVEHYWVEFFIPRVGWIPADPAVGDGLLDQDFSRLLAFYGEQIATATFGRIDGRRVTFALDGRAAPPWYPLGGVIPATAIPAFSEARVEVPFAARLAGIDVRFEPPLLVAELPVTGALR